MKQLNINIPRSIVVLSSLLSLCIISIGCSGANDLEQDWRQFDPLEIAQRDGKMTMFNRQSMSIYSSMRSTLGMSLMIGLN